MRLFSDCSGDCCVCANEGGCLAGHGDDFYSKAQASQVIERIRTGKYKDNRLAMIKFLKDEYHIDVERTVENDVDPNVTIPMKKYCVKGFALFDKSYQEFVSYTVDVEDTIFEKMNKDAAIGAWMDICNSNGRVKGSDYKIVSVEEV